MAAFVVRIKWRETEEFVPVNLTAGPDDGLIDTCEMWDSGEVVEYCARYRRTNDEEGAYRFELDYRFDNDARRAEWPDIDLGQSQIVIPRNLKHARASWISQTRPADWTGPANDCKVVLDSSFDVEREIERYDRTAIKRPGQVMMREMLFAIDGRCAVTKESTRAALEAAHINGVADRGVDAVGNGILLRADLHRLYDSGAFDITPDGEITIRSDLSDYYCTLLADARIDERIMARIRRNLERRQARA